MDEKDNRTETLPDISIEQRDRLITVLESLEDLTKKQVSLKSVFIRGALYGLSTVIGATVLISILSFITLNIFGSDISDKEAAKEKVNSFLSL